MGFDVTVFADSKGPKCGPVAELPAHEERNGKEEQTQKQ